MRMHTKLIHYWILLTCFICIQFSTIAQTKLSKDSVIKYIDHTQNLDPIEGIWTLNVDRTLYLKKDSIGNETEYFRSEWAIIRGANGHFNVIDIGGAENETGSTDFSAYFTSTQEKNVYSYVCNFLQPKWTAKAQASLTDGVLLRYEYFANKTYMKDAYKKDYIPGLLMHWLFTWSKKHPRIKEP